MYPARVFIFKVEDNLYLSNSDVISPSDINHPSQSCHCSGNIKQRP